jgi:hypothetical protein
MTKFQSDVVELLNNNLSLTEVAKKLNKPTTSVYSAYIRNKDIICEIKKENKKYTNDSFFSEINTEIQAYLLGFFLADGCIHSDSNRMEINIQKDDKYILELFQKYIAPDSKIFYKNRKDILINRKEQGTIRYSSIEIKNSLEIKWNIKSKKTYDDNFVFPFKNLNKSLIRHFIRGFFDGDGYVGQNGITNNILFSFVTTSEQFANQLAEYTCFNNCEKTIRKTIGKTIDWYILRYNFGNKNKEQGVFDFYTYLYKDANFFLERKKVKFIKYLEYRGKL